MRRTVVVDDKLLEEAREALGTKSIRETIELGLREVGRRHRLEQLRRSLGTVDLALPPAEWQRLRDAE